MKIRAIIEFNTKTCSVLLASIVLCACSSRVEPPSDLAKVSGAPPSVEKEHVANAQNAGPGEKFNAEEDEIISNETLKAWRHALAHDERGEMPEAEWKELRKKDEAESMVALKDLALRHQTASYIKTMMGQVMQHFGHKQEAADYYEEAMLQNRREPVLIFKIAEMRRTSGNMPRAMGYYKKVLEIQPDFPGAQLGLARCLLADKDTAADGRKMVEDIVAKNPKDAEAKAILNGKADDNLQLDVKSDSKSNAKTAAKSKAKADPKSGAQADSK